jgi:putative membrane protein
MWLRQVGHAFRRWQGIVLVVAALVSTVWLAITNQLILYIHPRYIVFTVIMAALGLVLVIASFVSTPHHDHDHDHDHDDDGRPSRVGTVISIGATVLTLVMAVGLVVVPPATLTTATADQRVINSTTVGAGTKTVSSAVSAPAGAFAKFTVLDWSSLLRQTSDASFYAGKSVDIVGFISKDTGDTANVFYVSRFVITCCAVDAQPVGVPVYLPNWQNGFKADQWVRVTGSFDTNPSSKSNQPIALVPTKTTPVEQPSEPYLY